MKILLAIIITATFSFGCAMLEGEQTTSDSGGGGTTTPTPAPAVASWSGTKQLGTTSTDFAYGITSDSSRNVYMTGKTHGNLDGNSSASASNIFLTKIEEGPTHIQPALCFGRSSAG